MCKLAVLNANPRDLRELSIAFERVNSKGDDPEQFSEADELFHLAIAHCTGNPLMVSLYEQINEVRRRVHWDAMKNKILTSDRMSFYNGQHAELNDALRSREVDKAVHTITQHLQAAKFDLLGAQAER